MCRLTEYITNLGRDNVSPDGVTLASGHIMGLFQLLDKIERRVQAESQNKIAAENSQSIFYTVPNE